MSGRHSAIDAVIADIETDAFKQACAKHAELMSGWLAASVLTFNPLYPEHGDKCSSELEQWCRTARNLLEAASLGD